MRAKIVSILATALVVIFSSCKKETTTNPDPAKNTSVTAKVDGVRFQSNDADTDGIYTTSDGGVYLTANTGGSVILRSRNMT